MADATNFLLAAFFIILFVFLIGLVLFDVTPSQMIVGGTNKVLGKKPLDKLKYKSDYEIMDKYASAMGCPSDTCDKLIIYFSEEYCGYCKDFNPVWDQLAKVVPNNLKNVKFIKVDRTEFFRANGQLVSVKYVPTIMRYSSLDKSIYLFSGERNIKSIHDFARKL